jgi:hypothetical protein
MRREIAVAPTDVCFAERGKASWGEGDWQVWAGRVNPAYKHEGRIAA